MQMIVKLCQRSIPSQRPRQPFFVMNSRTLLTRSKHFKTSLQMFKLNRELELTNRWRFTG